MRTYRARALGMAMMQKVVLAALLIVMPFGGIRVICVDSPAPPLHSGQAEGGSTNPQPHAASNCERLCPFHPASSRASSSERGSDCALSADASSLSMFASIAVLRPQEPLQEPRVIAAAYVDPAPAYIEPELVHIVPPPKLQAL